MTKVRALGPFALVSIPTQSRKDDSLGKSGLSKIACFVFAFCFATIAAPAQTFTSLVSFDGTNGANPEWGALIQGLDGNLYGNAGGAYSGGSVFKITPGGTLTVLHNFTGGTDGTGPMPGLMLATDGNFYGVNSDGGASGSGVAFRITPSGTFTTLHAWVGPEGRNPNSDLVEAGTGAFYGTTVNGGSAGCNAGCGTVFEMTPDGTVTDLHNFDFLDGWDAVGAGMIQASDGNLYGETAGGGFSPCNTSDVNCGVIFKIAPSGTFSVLHRFTGPDGGDPAGGLLEAPDGNFYGTNYAGGANGDGTAFKITPGGVLTTLHSFDGTDGTGPYGGVILATDGNFYGTTRSGGANGDGTIFEITPGGTLTKLHDFAGADGATPMNGLLQATNGTFYGTTYGGGASGNGTVFSLSTGLGPFVTFLSAAGVVGRTVDILGQGFTGATAVSFNGTPATFTVWHDTFLTATVPAGATTGFVTVTASSGTLQSNKTFLVGPQISSFSPTSGPVGTSVVITGESFTGAKEVIVGAGQTPASFTVDSDTQITAIVPAGATGGKIGVSTPGGATLSAASFNVTP
jgi:uncharacterized repeat protein (TIGR03803 family)